jgi:hypothetical protein
LFEEAREDERHGQNVHVSMERQIPLDVVIWASMRTGTQDVGNACFLSSLTEMSLQGIVCG